MDFTEGSEYVLTKDFLREEHYLDSPLIIPKGTILEYVKLYDRYTAQFYTESVIPTYFYINNIFLPKEFWKNIVLYGTENKSIACAERRTIE